MSKQDLNKGMMNYIQASPTPFHAVSSMVSQLEAAGFTHLGEGEHWKLEQGRGYFVTRSESSIIAFKTGSNDLANNGFHIASHCC